MFDTTSYYDGSLTISMVTAQEAMNRASSDALIALGYDDPLTTAIHEIQDKIDAARKLARRSFDAAQRR